MDNRLVTQVQSTWESVKTDAPQAGQLFYDNLFAKDPSLRPLFKGDMSEQSDKLMQMIGVAVNSLDDPGTLMPALTKLGIRHAGYGVEASHYATVGAALLETLEQGLGDAFTPEVRDAWVAVYGTMAAVMIEAGQATEQCPATK